MAYDCQFCTNWFKSISNCYRHARVAHKEAIQEYWIQCPNCKKYFPTMRSLITHKKANCLVCDHCSKLLTTNSHLRNHLEQNHPEEMSKHWTKCSACDKKFRVGKSFTKHWSLCPQNKRSLITHKKVYHLVCEHCKEVLTSRNEKRKHIKENHLEEMSKYWTKCSACDEKFRVGPSFKQHSTICQRKEQRTCQECKKMFSTKQIMLTHARVMHVKLVEQFWSSSCPDCKLPFPSMAEVEEHVCLVKLTSTKNDLNLDNIDVTLEWLMSKKLKHSVGVSDHIFLYNWQNRTFSSNDGNF
jgi:thiol-disulfide isomerase/thioredoxin